MILSRKIVGCGLSILAASILGSCGRAEPEGGGLRIIIDRPSEATNAMSTGDISGALGFQSLDELIGIKSVPTTTSDFNCFAVNVTGSGISSSGHFEDCTTPDNFGGPGQGILSDTFPAGASVSLLVPSGPARRIDVFGVYPPGSGCVGGGGGEAPGSASNGYRLGSTTIDLVGDTTVRIPVSFTAGSAASVTCTSRDTLVPLSNAGQSSCVTSGLPATHAAPTGSPPGAYTGGDLTEMRSNNGTAIETAECFSSPGSQQVYEEYHFDLSSYNLSQFSGFRIYWKGRAGRYAGSCTTSTSQAFDGNTGSLYVYRYNGGGSPVWEQIGTPTAGTAIGAVSYQVFMNASTYAYSGNILIFRMYAPNTATSQCSAVVTDFVALGLVK